MKKDKGLMEEIEFTEDVYVSVYINEGEKSIPLMADLIVRKGSRLSVRTESLRKNISTIIKTSIDKS